MTSSDSDTGSARAAVALPADLGIEQCDALRDLLLQHVAADSDVTLDGSAVTRLHTSGLQLLAMFWRDRVAARRATRWHEPSAALRGAAQIVGLTDLLHLESARP